MEYTASDLVDVKHIRVFIKGDHNPMLFSHLEDGKHCFHIQSGISIGKKDTQETLAILNADEIKEFISKGFLEVNFLYEDTEFPEPTMEGMLSDMIAIAGIMMDNKAAE